MGVVVLGMHRSGTSVATRAINLLGVPMCRPEDVYPPTRWNATGYWESASLAAFDELLLECLGGCSKAPPPLPPGWPDDPRLARLRAVAGRLFAAVFPTGQWVWKDPRACLTLPFWDRALDRRHPVVLVLRDPLAVARSLARRDGRRPEHALALWERYTRSALAASAGRPALVSAYEALVADPAAWAAEAAAFLARQGVLPSPAVPAGAIHGLLAAQPVTARPGTEPPDAAAGMSAERAALRRACAAAQGGHDRLPALDLGPEDPRTERLFAALRPRPAVSAVGEPDLRRALIRRRRVMLRETQPVWRRHLPYTPAPQRWLALGPALDGVS